VCVCDCVCVYYKGSDSEGMRVCVYMCV